MRCAVLCALPLHALRSSRYTELWASLGFLLGPGAVRGPHGVIGRFAQLRTAGRVTHWSGRIVLRLVRSARSYFLVAVGGRNGAYLFCLLAMIKCSICSQQSGQRDFVPDAMSISKARAL